MKKRSSRLWLAVIAVLLMCVSLMTMTAVPHHSFAMYDQTKKLTLTGKLTRFIPGANHAQIIFELLGPDGKPSLDSSGRPIQWGVEMGPAVQIARQGVTVKNFPEGTIIGVTLNPLRDGRTFGALPTTGGRLIKCGSTMPEGGCNEKTGKIFIGLENVDVPR